MKKLGLLGCALVVAANAAQGQASTQDFAAWFGMMSTPVGAFPAIETSVGGRTDGPRQFAARFASWKFESADDRVNNFGVSFMAPGTSKLRYGLTAGWSQPSDADEDGIFLVGGDLASALWQSAANASSAHSFSLDWKASLGFGRYTGTDGGNAWSLVAQVPFKWKYTMANKSDLSAYASAGFGLAGVSEADDSESGTRPMYGFGGAWTSAGGIGIHLGWQIIPLDLGLLGDAPGVGALSVSFPVGGTR